MVRLAEGNFFKVSTFYDLFFGRDSMVWARDVDHHAPAWLLEGLSARTGLPQAKLEAMTLRHFEGAAYERLNPQGATRWVMSLGVFHRERRGFGQQFCACCLATDPTPHLRLRWRLSMSMVCTKHQVYLQDRCRGCGRSFVWHRRDVGSPTLPAKRSSSSACPRCGHEMRDDAVAAEACDLRMQARIDTVLDDGYFVLGDGIVYSHLFFDGIAALVSGLARAGGTGQPSLDIDPPMVRARRLRPVFELLDVWPARFVARCQHIRRPYTTFTKDQDRVPYWLHDVLRREFSSIAAPLSHGEVEAIRSYTGRLVRHVSSKATSKVSGRDLSRYTIYRRVDDDAADLLLVSIDHRISEASGPARQVLLRDKAMLIAGRYLSLGYPDLAALQANAFPYGGEPLPTWEGVRTADEARVLLGWFGAAVRSKWPNTPTDGAMFLLQSGAPMSVQSIGARFQLAIDSARLWASVRNWSAWARPPRRLRRPTVAWS